MPAHNHFCTCGRPLETGKCIVCDADELKSIRLQEEQFEERYHKKKEAEKSLREDFLNSYGEILLEEE